ncbi:Cysteine-rich receptor-like protein kinase [Thalictrum thalictroides]|uniref:Cysteine-rich receptor-like protein kinase n=1 Tax=Thalictrum thalictroides TaxID=46969 RepID=A0A7J6UUM2_THATH|nr:Cysteine-rich receptor-like protein kinase [Thalictrum thalictroides]
MFHKIYDPHTYTVAGHTGSSSKTIVIVVVSTVIGALLLLSTIAIYLRPRRRLQKEKVDEVEEMGSVESLHYNFKEIQNATNNFSDTNKLGRGGFGFVYKGTLSDGQEVAVKRLVSSNSGQGAVEFKNESDRSEDLISYAWRQWKAGTTLELIDSTLLEDYSSSEVMRCIHIGLLCVQEDVATRPTMATVVFMLNRDSLVLPLPSTPAYFVDSREPGEHIAEGRGRLKSTQGSEYNLSRKRFLAKSGWPAGAPLSSSSWY